MDGKRSAEDKSDGGASKRQKTEEFALTVSQNPTGGQKNAGAVVAAGPVRTSNLQAPIMQLNGHKGEVLTLKFNSAGTHVLSAGSEKNMFLWNVAGDCENTAVFSGHKNAIQEVEWSNDDVHAYSASADKSVVVWNIEEGLRIRRLTGHGSFVNAISAARRGPPFLLSASDDRTVKLWDARTKSVEKTYDCRFPVTAVQFSDNGAQFFCGGIDNDIKVWDVRKGQVPVYTLKGHADTIASLSLSKDGSYLLSCGMDNQVRAWDVRPFVAGGERYVRSFEGVQHNFDKNLIKCAWAPDGNRVACGSSDRCVYIWDFDTGKTVYRLPGHNGTVNEVAFHPHEPIIGSGGSDKKVFLGEISTD